MIAIRFILLVFLFSICSQAIASTENQDFDFDKATLQSELIYAGKVQYLAANRQVKTNLDLGVPYDKHLKGSKVSPRIPIRLKENAFSKRPKIGDEYIIFVENAVPIDGMFETFHGVGVVPCTEENLDRIKRILSIERAYDQSENVMAVEYCGKDESRLRFRATSFLKGSKFGSSIFLNDHRLSENGSLAKNSRWIIFIKEAVPVNGVFPLEDEVGAIPYSDTNMDLVGKIIEIKKKTGARSAPEDFDLEKAYLKCESVVVGEYKCCDKRREISIKNPPLARFQCNKYFKGPKYSTWVPAHYRLDDKLSESGKRWKFSESMMPRLGTEHIIFIEYAVPVDGAFETWNGSKGIVPASEENIKQLMEILKKYSQEMR